MRKVLGGLVLASAVAGFVRLDAASAFPDQVKVTGGTVKGAAADGVLSFKGIPFAAPPVGDLRWRPPQPVTPWTGVKEATAYGHDCAQKPVAIDAAPLGTEPSEDCLVINVWRPAEKKGALPVMVWIYGGGFVNGGSSPSVYDGSQFARQGVILVSFNYRLGRFGFFAHPALSAEHAGEPLGNYALMDQIAALQWVQQNIAAFDGNPKDVTVFGESAGGMSVHALLTSPAAKGLFHKAIIESGGGRSGLLSMRKLKDDLPNQPSAEAVGVAFAKANGIEGADAAALKALRDLPADKVVGGLNFMTMGSANGTYVGGPILDGTIMVESVEQSYAAGHNMKVPMLVGANSMDIGFTFAKTMDELMKGFGPDADKALAAYDPDKSGNLQKVGYQVAMDRIMIEPARFTAKTFAAQGQPAYLYRFSYVAESIRAKTPGAPHATEIPYVFDTVKAKYGAALTAADEATARAANAYWANFAKTGNPNGAGLETWPAYKADTNMLLDFTAAGPKAMADPWQTRMDLTEAAATRGR